jgi:type IV pilus assembly protein PilY1
MTASIWRNVASATLGLLLFVVLGASRAQDVEVFGGNNPATEVKPNVLIVLDNTANWQQSIGTAAHAWDPELLALSNTISSLSTRGLGSKVRVGLMMLTPRGTDGGYVRYSIRLMDSTNAAQLSNLALTMRAENAGSGNPEQANNAAYAQAMNEAYLYFFGKSTRAGTADPRRDCSDTFAGNQMATPAPGYDLHGLGSYGYSSCAASGVTYVAPPEATSACNRNFIVFISNGPIDSSDNGPGLALLRAAVNAEGAASSYLMVIPVVPNGETAANYADEWARFLNDVKNVQTFTINANDKYTGQTANHAAMMRSMATAGGGDNCDAFDPASIQECLDATFNNILAIDSVFASVSLPVSTNPQLQHLDQLYMGMFRPDAEGNPRWFGNLKQYQLALDVNNNRAFIADAAGSSAVDTSTGQLFATARSFWTTSSNYWSFEPRGTPPSASDLPDGPLVEKGGAAQRLRTAYAASGSTPVTSRRVFTCVGCSSQTSLTGGTDTSTGATSFSSANAASLASALRVSAAEAPALIKWVRGENVESEKSDGLATEARPSIHGDVLHSSPTVLTVSDTNVYVSYGTTDGMIHLIRGGRDSTAGNEVWAFLPEEFFPKMNRLRHNSPVTWSFDTITTTVTLTSGSATATVGSATGLSVGMYVEGTTNIPRYTSITSIDPAASQITLSNAALGAFSGTARFVPEAKPMLADGATTIYKDPTNSRTYLFSAIRRGGRFIYAFDITDPVNPLYLWRRGCDHAGITTNNGYGCDAGYEDGAGHAFGQSWSQLRVGRVGNSLNFQTVLIFGAGYDPTVEDADPALTSGRTMGQGVFVVNPYTGNVIRRVRPTNMDYAVPSDISLIDLDGNGFVDRLYFGDTGGQVWRVDTNGDQDPTNWTTQRIASLGVGPDSGFGTAAHGRKFLFAPDVVETAPGSGVYAILLVSGDRENPLNGATDRSSAPVVVNRLYSLRDGAARGSTVITESRLEDRTENNFTTLNDNLGWYIRLAQSGEKGTGSVLTLAGTAYFGTNYPVAQGSTQCFSTVGNARFYTINFLTGAGTGFGWSASDITLGRFTETPGGGMPPSPVGTILAIGNTFVESVLSGTTIQPVGPAKIGDRFRNYWYKLFGK